MAVFTSNQVNHVYVAKAVNGTANDIDGGNLGYTTTGSGANTKEVKPSVSNNGDIFCWKTADNELYFTYKNGDGGIVRSDLIPIKNIMWARVISGNHRTQKRTLKKYTITVPSYYSDASNVTADAKNGVTLTAVLEMTLHNGVESIYRKTASVAVRSGDTVSELSKRLGESLKESFERDDYVNDKFKVSQSTSGSAPNITYGAISIIEKPQSAKYKRGLFENEEVQFRVFTEDNLTVSGPTPATLTDINGSGGSSNYTIGNAYNIADLEYFALGERGDKYRNIGWPNAVPSKCVADAPTDSAAYNILQIHFAFTDSNEGVQKSEKDITIAIPMDTPVAAGTGTSAVTVVTSINKLLRQMALKVLGAGGSGRGAYNGNDAFDLVDGKIEVLDIPGGKKTQLD